MKITSLQLWRQPLESHGMHHPVELHAVIDLLPINRSGFLPI